MHILLDDILFLNVSLSRQSISLDDEKYSIWIHFTKESITLN